MSEFNPIGILVPRIFRIVRILEEVEKIKQKDGSELTIHNDKQNKYWAKSDDGEEIIVCIDQFSPDRWVEIHELTEDVLEVMDG